MYIKCVENYKVHAFLIHINVRFKEKHISGNNYVWVFLQKFKYMIIFKGMYTSVKYYEYDESKP